MRRALDATPLRAAVIGCGRIGAAFADPRTAVLTHAAPTARVCANRARGRVRLLRAETTKACAREWGVTGFVDVDEMLQVTMPDVVSICTPDDTHAALAERILQSPSVRGILMEKPLALTIADAEQTVLLAEERNVILAVNYLVAGLRGSEI